MKKLLIAILRRLQPVACSELEALNHVKGEAERLYKKWGNKETVIIEFKCMVIYYDFAKSVGVNPTISISRHGTPRGLLMADSQQSVENCVAKIEAKLLP